jgi:hypothetical protein
MGMPMANGIAQIAVLGHHVGHRTGFGRRQLFVRDDGVNTLVDLSF